MDREPIDIPNFPLGDAESLPGSYGPGKLSLTNNLSWFFGINGNRRTLSNSYTTMPGPPALIAPTFNRIILRDKRRIGPEGKSRNMIKAVSIFIPNRVRNRNFVQEADRVRISNKSFRHNPNAVPVLPVAVSITADPTGRTQGVKRTINSNQMKFGPKADENSRRMVGPPPRRPL